MSSKKQKAKAATPTMKSSLRLEFLIDMYVSSSEGTFVNNVTPWKQTVTLSIFASNWTLCCLPCFVNIASTLIVNNNFLFMLRYIWVLFACSIWKFCLLLMFRLPADNHNNFEDQIHPSYTSGVNTTRKVLYTTRINTYI